MNKPYSIRIFLPDGDADGLRIIEKSNWSGCGIAVPRTLVGRAKQRKELDRTGVYLLVGAPEESGLAKVYIGEGDPIRPRIEQHSAKKDFWTQCIAFTSKDDNLNKAHVQFIESRLIDLAKEAKRCVLDNGNAPAPPSLSEADAADAESFLADLVACCPILGLHVFSPASVAQGEGVPLQIVAKGIEAAGIESAEGFVVRKGSRAVANETPSCPGFVTTLRKALIENGVLHRDGDSFIFTQDYVFNSPSMAASVVQARSANGRLDWKTKDGRRLVDVQ
jgi:hypothetical protein